MVCVRVSGRSKERKTSVTVKWVSVCFDQRHTDRLVWVPVCVWTHTQTMLEGEHAICVWAWTCVFDWLCACVFAPRERVFERQYRRAAGSPKVSTLDPWPESTGARLQSADSPGTEERRTDTVATRVALIFFLFPPFVLNRSKEVISFSNLSLIPVYHQPLGILSPLKQADSIENLTCARSTKTLKLDHWKLKPQNVWHFWIEMT